MALKLVLNPEEDDEQVILPVRFVSVEVDDDAMRRNDALDPDYDPSSRRNPARVSKPPIHSLIPTATPLLLLEPSGSATSTRFPGLAFSQKYKPLRFSGSFSNVGVFSFFALRFLSADKMSVGIWYDNRG